MKKAEMIKIAKGIFKDDEKAQEKYRKYGDEIIKVSTKDVELALIFINGDWDYYFDELVVYNDHEFSKQTLQELMYRVLFGNDETVADFLKEYIDFMIDKEYKENVLSEEYR